MTLQDQLSTPLVKLADTLLGGALKEAADRATTQDELLKAQGVALDELFTELYTSPWRSVPAERLEKFSEQGLFDPQLLAQQLRFQSFDLIAGLEGGVSQLPGFREQDRRRAVAEGRDLFRRSPVAKWGIETWTNFGLGESVGVEPKDEGAKEAWSEFLHDDRNMSAWSADGLADMANHLKVTGNRFLTFTIAEADGSSIMRSVNPDEIVDIVTHPEDDQTALFYKRVWTPKGSTTAREWYYPDWLAFFSDEGQLLDKERPERTADREAKLEAGGLVDADVESQIKTLAQEVLPQSAKRTDKMFSFNKTGTAICMMHIADNRLNEASLYGWPITTDGAPWLRSVQRFFEARLAVAMSKAQYTRRIQVAGGSRAVQLAQRLRQSAYQRSTGSSETNPPPAPGSEDIMNRAVDVEELPMSTGSGDARSDAEMFVWMALLSLGLFPHYGGIDTQRYATVAGMEKPLLVQFGRYQLFWSSQFKRIVRIVLESKMRYDGKSYDTLDSDVSIDKLVELDLENITKGLGRWFTDVLNPNAEQGIVDSKSMSEIIQFTTKQVLLTLGAAEPETLTAGMDSSAEAISSALSVAYRMMQEEVITKETAGLLVKYLAPEENAK